jgi:hypothetical protein
VLLPVYTFFLHSSFLVPLCNVHNFFFNFSIINNGSVKSQALDVQWIKCRVNVEKK